MTAELSSLEVRVLGLSPYAGVWQLQKDLQSALISGSGKDTLLLCEHPPVITCGRSTKPENLLLKKEDLKRHGIELFEIERGGDVTFHGPGQLVAYPIVNLNLKKRDVGWYMRSIEEVIIAALSHWGIKGVRLTGRTGVWIDEHRKISSIGVRISRWCTMHGVALNVAKSAAGFQYINPCGFTDIAMTSMEEQLGIGVDVTEVIKVFVPEFCRVFSYTSNPLLDANH